MGDWDGGYCGVKLLKARWSVRTLVIGDIPTIAMQLHRRSVLNRVFVAVLTAALPFTTAALTMQPAEPAAPSPSSYPDIASSTLPGLSAGGDASPTGNIQPTPVPELRRRLLRRQLGTLGWEDVSVCNVGVCGDGLYCTVFEVSGSRDSIVTGACCHK